MVLSLLPSYEGKSVLELGAGIGHFTGELAKIAGNVLALDFIESAIKKVCFLHLRLTNLDSLRVFALVALPGIDGVVGLRRGGAHSRLQCEVGGGDARWEERQWRSARHAHAALW